jgi:hypothetical protein
MQPCAQQPCSDGFGAHAAGTSHTESCGASFAELLSRDGGSAWTGKANAFLSHAYSYKFLDAVDAADAWASRQSEAARNTLGGTFYFYFDLLVVNQHGQNGIVSFETLRDEFGGGVRGIGNTLFLLDYDNPVSLTRAWCVFEVAVSLANGARFEVIMPSRDEAAFEKALLHDYDQLITLLVLLSRLHLDFLYNLKIV